MEASLDFITCTAVFTSFTEASGGKAIVTIVPPLDSTVGSLHDCKKGIDRAIRMNKSLICADLICKHKTKLSTDFEYFVTP